MKPKGWRNESRRHSLASKGIKTAQKIPKAKIKPLTLDDRTRNVLSRHLFDRPYGWLDATESQTVDDAFKISKKLEENLELFDTKKGAINNTARYFDIEYEKVAEIYNVLNMAS